MAESALAASTTIPQELGGTGLESGGISIRLHVFVTLSCGVFFLLSCGVVPWYGLALGIICIGPVLCLPSVIWHERGSYKKRDAALILPWLGVLFLLLRYVAAFAGSLHFPFRDQLLIAADKELGINVAAIVASVGGHPHFRQLWFSCYGSLPWLLAVAALLPPLVGDKRSAERFLAAGTLSFLAAIPLFCFFPAIGPWAGFGFSASAAQLACETSAYAMRRGLPAATFGIICLPSFHVVWAIISASVLWRYKLAGILAAGMAALIVVSTVMTGWHYGVDVIVGVVWAFGSLWVSDRLLLSAGQASA